MSKVIVIERNKDGDTVGVYGIFDSGPQARDWLNEREAVIPVTHYCTEWFVQDYTTVKTV